MKKFLPVALFSLMSAATAWAGDKTYQMDVAGLSCEHCANAVKGKLNALDGVKQVDVDLGKGKVTVATAETVEITEPQMQELLASAGFKLRGFSQTAAGE